MLSIADVERAERAFTRIDPDTAGVPEALLRALVEAAHYGATMRLAIETHKNWGEYSPSWWDTELWTAAGV